MSSRTQGTSRRALGHCALTTLLVLLSGCLGTWKIESLRADLGKQVQLGKTAEAQATTQEIEKEMVGVYGEGTDLYYRHRISLARSYGNWGKTDQAVAMGEQVLAELQRRYGPNGQRTVMGLIGLANIHVDALHWTQAEQLADRASAICPTFYPWDGRSGEPEDCNSSVAGDIYYLYLAVGASEKAVRIYLAMDEVSYLPDRQSGIALLTVIGRYHAQGGHYPQALWYLQRCVDESRSSYQPQAADLRPGASGEQKVWSSPSGDVELVVMDSPHSFDSQSPRCLEDVIEIQQKLGNQEEAQSLAAWQRELWATGPNLEKYLKQRIAYTAETSRNDGSTSGPTYTLGYYYAGKGQTAGAISAYEEAIRLLTSFVMSPQPPTQAYPGRSFLRMNLELAALYQKAGRPDDACAAFRRAWQFATIYAPPRDAARLEIRAGLAGALAAAGRMGESEAEWQNYLASAVELRGRHHLDYAVGLTGLANTLHASGRSAQAAKARGQSAAIRADYARRVAAVCDLPLPMALRSPPSPAN